MEFLLILSTRYEVIGRKYFQPNIDPIDSQELTNIFKTLVKEKFIEFELDIQFLIAEVIMASVDINVLGLRSKDIQLDQRIRG